MENKPQTLNPFVVLMQQNLHKDIDDNFIEIIEVLFLLNKNYPDLLMESAPLIFQDKKANSQLNPDYQPTTSLGTLLKQKLMLNSNNNYEDYEDWGEEDSNQYSQVNNIESSYFWSDFLTLKLSENLRRIYAFHKMKKNQNPFSSFHKKPVFNKTSLTDIASLLKQQDNIYYLFNKIYPQLKINEQLTFYPKLLLGKNVKCSFQEALFYLSFHDGISEKNKPTHIQLCTSFPLEKNEKIFLPFYQRVSYLENKIKDVQKILQSFPDNFFLNLVQQNNQSEKQPLSSGSFFVDLIQEIVQRNIPLNHHDKTTLLKTILSAQNNLLFHQKASFGEKIYDNIKDYFQNIHLNDDDVLRNCFSTPNSALTKLILCFTPKLSNAKLLTDNILNNNNISPQIQNEMIAKYDFQNSDFIVKCFTNISLLKPEKIHALMNLLQPYFDANILSLIIAKNKELLPILKPFYQQYILNENLPKKETTHQKIKI